MQQYISELYNALVEATSECKKFNSMSQNYH